ncbi:MAG: rRNA maturation RNase YbeY [Candidatus Paceibacterota bacterium]
MENLVVDVDASSKKFSDKKERLKKALPLALSYLSIEEGFLEVNLITDNEMRELNKTYRGKDEVTNVLSFEEPKDVEVGQDELNHLGEVYIAPDEIDRRKEDFIYITIHGLLHLLGFNHKNDEEAEEMENKEEEILEKISDI